MPAPKKKPVPSSTSTTPVNQPRTSLNFAITAHNADQELSVTFNYSANNPGIGFLFKNLILQRLINLFQRLRGQNTVRSNPQRPYIIVGQNNQPIYL